MKMVGTCTDKRGIKRGACKNELCDGCTEYEWDTDKGTECQYCGCFPSKHARTEDADTQQKMEIVSIDAHQKSAIPLPPIHHDKNASKVNEDTPNISTFTGKDDTINNNYQIEMIAEENTFLIGNSVNAEFEVTDLLMNQNVQMMNPNNESHASSVQGILAHLSRNDKYALCVPSVLPQDVVETVNRGKAITPKQRQAVLRWVVLTMDNFKLDSEEDVVQVATLLITKYPAIQCSLDLGYKGVVKAMKEIKRNHRYYEMNKSKKAKESDTSAEKASLTSLNTQIQNAFSAENPSVTVLKNLLKLFRQDRLTAARKGNCAAHIKDFPCLEEKDLLFWEFLQQENLTFGKEDMRMNWVCAIPKMCQYFSGKHGEISPTLSEEQKTVEILSRIVSPSFFGPKKLADRTDGRNHIIQVFDVFNIHTIICFDEKKLVSERQPKADDPPRIIAIGDVKKDQMCGYIYVDGRAMFSGSIVDCVLHLVAVYNVFQILPLPNCRGALAFIQGILLPDHSDETYKKYKNVLNALETIRDM